MAEQSVRLDPDGPDPEVERELVAPPEVKEDAPVHGRWGLRELEARRSAFEQSAAGRYWAHLSTADFMNSSFAFAALAVLSALARASVPERPLRQLGRRLVCLWFAMSPYG